MSPQSPLSSARTAPEPSHGPIHGPSHSSDDPRAPESAPIRAPSESSTGQSVSKTPRSASGGGNAINAINATNATNSAITAGSPALKPRKTHNIGTTVTPLGSAAMTAVHPPSPLIDTAPVNPHQRQYLLLPHKPHLGTAPNSAQKKKHPMPPKLDRVPSNRRFIFSVDDDEDEIEADMEREYLEGYNDALKHRYRKLKHKADKCVERNAEEDRTRVRKDGRDGRDRQGSVRELKRGLEHEISHSLAVADEALSQLEEVEAGIERTGASVDPEDDDAVAAARVGIAEEHHSDASGYEEESETESTPAVSRHKQAFNLLPETPSIPAVDLTPPAEPESDAGSAHSGDSHGSHHSSHSGLSDHSEHSSGSAVSGRGSATSLETFTLRERQDAINTTHPFGIRIWKPALYKKIRSVQKVADEDIHALPGKKASRLVVLGDLLWSATFGLLLATVCAIGALGLGIVFWSPSAAKYARVFARVGRYLLYPFGRVVELAQDERYRAEDSGEGGSVSEYRAWRFTDEEAGMLFFEPRARASGSVGNVGNVGGGQSATNDVDGQLAVPNAATETDDGHSVLLGETHPKRRLFGRGPWTLGRILFYIWFHIIVQPLLYLVSVCCWLGVFSIPMAKVCSTIAAQLRRHPLALKFAQEGAYAAGAAPPKPTLVVLCTYRAFGWSYAKYTIDGTNIFLINLMAPVLFVIFDYYVIRGYFGVISALTSSGFLFFCALASVIPLAYFIGQAVASISAQSSMGVGAVLNAFFSTIVEVFLYIVALQQGKGDIVEGSIIGSILGAVLLLPGLSMCGGAIRRKTQRYNPKSAGVSSTMLLFASVATFAPTLFYQIYGTYEMRCGPCGSEEFTVAQCSKCHMYQLPLEVDQLYTAVVRPFSYICSLLLFISYVVGLWFTLRTHAALIWQTPTAAELHGKPGTAVAADEEAGGHDAPNWSRRKSTLILLGATVLYAIIAEILVDTVDFLLERFPLNSKVVGLTIFALVPNTTEFLNAISFAVHGNVALSMEIGSAYVLQVCLLQIPALVLWGIWSSIPVNGPLNDFVFTLIFPRWDIIASMLSVFLFTYIYAEGKSNYFKGSILILTYAVCIVGFYFTGKIEDSKIIATPFMFGVNDKSDL